MGGIALITADQIQQRMIKEVFDQPVLDNNIRGYWCEYMIAEALGPECRAVGGAWHPWDLQIGDERDTFPKRIRIQVKNSARLQTWNIKTGKLSACQWDLKFRKRPDYFRNDNPDVSCEKSGFMCDLYILCLHDEGDISRANQLDPAQWKFFLLPVIGPKKAITDSEFRWASEKLENTGKVATLQRRPGTLEEGIRGRRPIAPIAVSELTVQAIYGSLGLDKP
ncbi:MAG: hypothetical protein C0605_09815 [Hyphomicrobiales bacterium]|nr:MAG: hypothetical protein C0605_09815 [Hyphomicrobiales bacterium]